MWSAMQWLQWTRHLAVFLWDGEKLGRKKGQREVIRCVLFHWLINTASPRKFMAWKIYLLESLSVFYWQKNGNSLASTAFVQVKDHHRPLLWSTVQACAECGLFPWGNSQSSGRTWTLTCQPNLWNNGTISVPFFPPSISARALGNMGRFCFRKKD